jgi:putative transposase
MIRTFRFKLKPTRSQHNRLREALEYSRQLYNAALEERIDCYRKTGMGLTYADQCRGLTELRSDGSPYAVKMERAPLRAVDLAMKAFFKRGGYPRFKGREWFKSIAWTDNQGWKFDDRFYGKGLGIIRVQQHRHLPSKPKTARIKREGRHWFLFMACEVTPASNDNNEAIGLDLGLLSFAALSDGSLINNPRHGRRAHRMLRLRQRALARCKQGSSRRRKVRERLAKAHLVIRRSRRTEHFQMAADLTRRFGIIAIEDLNTRGLARSMLARDVNDAAWGQFVQILCDKAESAGCKVVKVNPRGTSQTCPECGAVKPKALKDRVHTCECGYTADRDVAAARVILMRAVHGPPEHNVGGFVVRAPRKAAA